MEAVAQALFPAAALIALGYVLNLFRVVDDGVWTGLERLVYFIFFPALLFLSLAQAELAGEAYLSLAVALVVTLLAMLLLAEAARRLMGIDGPAYTSLAQGVLRWNTYVAIVVAPGLFGPSALPLTAVAIAVLVPFANFLTVAVFVRHGADRTRTGIVGVLRAVLTHPLVLACIVGAAWNLAGLPLPGVVSEPLGILGRATLALALLTVGAGLRPATVRARPLLILLACGLQLVAKPLIGFATALAFGIEGVALGVVVLACGMPTATSTYILARLMGGDVELMAAIVTAQTLVAFVTLPLVLTLVL